jgi:putative transposase
MHAPEHAMAIDTATRAAPAIAAREPVRADHACIVTVLTLFRRPVFRDPEAARAVAQLHERSLPRRRACWLAWVLMPDHWQGLLVWPGDDPLPALVGRFKAMTTRAVAPRHRVNGWLWSRSFAQRPLAPDESLGDAARTLVAAPRRAGLVDSLAHYPYWDSAWAADDAPGTP